MFSCPQGNEVARNNASAVDNMSNQVDLVRDIEIDGRIFEQLKDPPGQKSQYILPGDTEREIYRLTTYIKFPLNSPVDVVLLAKFGFFYTGYKDRVKCFSCGMNIESWSVGDDPTMDSWHFAACALVCGTEERNVPVTSFMGNPQKLKFTHDPRNTRPPIDIADPGNSPSKQPPTLSAMQTDEIRDPPSELGKVTDSLNHIAIGGASSSGANSVYMTARYVPHPVPTNQMGKRSPTEPPVQGDTQPSATFPLLNPITPSMKNLKSRLDTFEKWPSQKVAATTLQIAEAGFFFLGDRDRAKCWYCNGGLQNWDYNDEPWAEHAKWYPGCEYVLSCKGVDFVRKIYLKNPTMRRPTITNGRTEYLPREFPSKNPPSAGDVLANFQPPSAAESSIETAMSGEVVSAATTMGFDADVIRIVQLNYITEHGEPISSVATLINELLEHDRASLKRTSDSTELQSSKQQKLGESDDQHDI